MFVSYVTFRNARTCFNAASADDVIVVVIVIPSFLFFSVVLVSCPIRTSLWSASMSHLPRAHDGRTGVRVDRTDVGLRDLNQDSCVLLGATGLLFSVGA